MITIDGGEYPEPEKKLSDFLITYTDSMGVRVSDYAISKNLNYNKIIKNINLVKEYDPNFWEILNEINQDL